MGGGGRRWEEVRLGYGGRRHNEENTPCQVCEGKGREGKGREGKRTDRVKYAFSDDNSEHLEETAAEDRLSGHFINQLLVTNLEGADLGLGEEGDVGGVA